MLSRKFDPPLHVSLLLNDVSLASIIIIVIHDTLSMIDLDDLVARGAAQTVGSQFD